MGDTPAVQKQHCPEQQSCEVSRRFFGVSLALGEPIKHVPAMHQFHHDGIMCVGGVEVYQVDDAVGSVAKFTVVVVVVEVTVLLPQRVGDDHAPVALPWGILEACRIERLEYLHLTKLRLVVLIAQFANV
jgi:hypothetical protein